MIDTAYMSEAFKEAKKAFSKDEVPVGCVITHANKIIARAHNNVETLKDPTAHAEIIAITQAASFLKSKWLQGCSVYVTIEPCQMCACALVLARIEKLVFGAYEAKTGAFGSACDIMRTKGLNHSFEVISGVMENESSQIMSDFFRNKRET